MRILELAVGAGIVAATWLSLVASLVMPRGLRSSYTRLVHGAVRWPFQFAADRCHTYDAKDRALAWAAPLGILVTLISWLAFFLAGFGLLLAGASGLSLNGAFREAGSSLFTLGFASSARDRLTFLDFAAAATGPVAIALQIGYLPALYSAYSRREAEVTLLQARAGVPAWGPEILSRHVQVVGLRENLPDLYRGWERWAAEISESHTNYPVLIHFRSPQPNRNWLIALLAVMDAAALELALNPSNRDAGAIRIGLRGGFTCLRDIAHMERIPYDPDPDPDSDIQLSFEEFSQGIDMLRYGGYPTERSPEEAWPHFRGWRVNYEATAYALAYRIDAVPAPWSGPRRTPGQLVRVRTPRDRQPTKGVPAETSTTPVHKTPDQSPRESRS
ncbi:hypothetical protein KGA66_11180 [Actinocrinis puniceicyclus]|uniref:Uncharacterized protein n=1 Tax=Actinocrinis puniceicyclus TaxID=977794 RepID=A0A8J7WJU7_9ACTN|nr:hypothetical protein [Actinocrinis puniceicyclus]MBS2963613.1 hypothetical protein [Actinocrinis puniceicyclus]